MGPFRPKIRRSIPALVAMLAIAPLARADVPAPSAAPPDSTETPKYFLDPVLVTGERTPIRSSRIPLEVATIEREQLDTERPVLLAEALRQIAPVDVQRSGSLGKLTDIRLRGADPRHTLVLFDDIALNGPWLGTFDFADLAAPGISRVEVVGGPASSLYGSAAVGGVIQILSVAATAENQQGAFSSGWSAARGFLEYGEQQTVRAGAEWRGGISGTPLGLSGTRLVSDGIGARDGYRGWNGNASSVIRLDPSDQVKLSALATEGVKELPYDFTFDPTDPTLSPFGSVKQIHDPNDDERDRLAAGTTTWRHRLDARSSLEGEVSGLYGEIHNDNRPSGPMSDFQDTKLKNTRGVGSLRARLAPGGSQVILGAEYRGDHVDRHDASSFGGFSSTSHVDQGIHTRSLYGQGHAERGRILLDLGIRLDDHSRYGTYGIPRAALGLDLRRAGLKLRGGYGRAFTAPTLSDLYYPGYSNDSLRPERSTTWEIGGDGRWLEGRLTAQATFHSTRFRDLIQSSSFFAPENLGEARIEGEDYTIGFAPDRRIVFHGNAAHLIAKKLTDSDPDPDRRLPKRPAWRFGAGVTARPASAVTLTGAWRWVDSVRDPFNFIDVTGRVLSGDTPGYASLDLGAAASLDRWTLPLELYLRVSNVLDRSYSEVKGYPALGRTTTIGLTFAP